LQEEDNAERTSGYWLMMPGAFLWPEFFFTYGAGLIFIVLYVAFKAYEVIIDKKPFRLGVPAKEMDLHSDLDHIEALTAASDAQRASHKRSVGQRVSDFVF
jgi:amino acid permease